VAINFFETFERPIVAGRGFTPSDIESARSVAIVDQTFVEHVLGGRDPIGLQVRPARRSPEEHPEPPIEIVGVVSDLATTFQARPENAVLYRPAKPRDIYPIHVAVHMRGEDPRSFAPRLRNVTASVDPTLRIASLTPLSEIGRGAQLTYEIFIKAFAVVGTIALLLSITGVYSLMSFTVARRTREIGVRAALGADPWRILASTFSRGSRQVGLGVLAGSVPGALLLTYGLPEGARGAGPLIGTTGFLGVGLVVMVVGGLACIVPARRALRIEPTEALRAEA
jgi:hypothetical protein